ncbi:MAG: hypothetical protein AAF679_02860, partial [Pseudomonadota bacterium]
MSSATDQTYRLSPFASIHARDSGDYVLGNAITGKYFAANRATVAFLRTLIERQSLVASAKETQLEERAAAELALRLKSAGLIESDALPEMQTPAAAGPWEGKLIFTRFDLLDGAPVTRALAPFGRLLFSWAAGVVWLGVLVLAAVALAEQPDRLQLTLLALTQPDWGHWAVVGACFLAPRVVHELGHSLAYARFCAAEGLRHGPIRMGISLFAFTPFPFTDVTGAWRLKSRWRRMMIGLGGLYLESWAAALAILVWASVTPTPFTDALLQTAVIAGAMGVAFNLNPLIRLDGY